MNDNAKNYGPPIVAAIWITSALIQPSVYHIASAITVAFLGLTLWLEWHKEVFK